MFTALVTRADEIRDNDQPQPQLIKIVLVAVDSLSNGGLCRLTTEVEEQCSEKGTSLLHYNDQSRTVSPASSGREGSDNSGSDSDETVRQMVRSSRCLR